MSMIEHAVGVVSLDRFAEISHMDHDEMGSLLLDTMAENAKLRELVRDLMPIVCDGCHERLCDMPKEEHPFVECLFDCRMRGMGIEVSA